MVITSDSILGQERVPVSVDLCTLNEGAHIESDKRLTTSLQMVLASNIVREY